MARDACRSKIRAPGRCLTASANAARSSIRFDEWPSVSMRRTRPSASVELRDRLPWADAIGAALAVGWLPLLAEPWPKALKALLAQSGGGGSRPPVASARPSESVFALAA